MKYLAYDRYNNDYTFFENEAEAKTEAEAYLESYHEEAAVEGYPEDLSGMIGYCRIISCAVEEIKADKKDFTDDEWIEEGYSLDFEKIVDYKFKRQE